MVYNIYESLHVIFIHSSFTFSILYTFHVLPLLLLRKYLHFPAVNDCLYFVMKKISYNRSCSHTIGLFTKHAICSQVARKSLQSFVLLSMLLCHQPFKKVTLTQNMGYSRQLQIVRYYIENVKSLWKYKCQATFLIDIRNPLCQFVCGSVLY